MATFWQVYIGESDAARSLSLSTTGGTGQTRDSALIRGAGKTIEGIPLTDAQKDDIDAELNTRVENTAAVLGV